MGPLVFKTYKLHLRVLGIEILFLCSKKEGCSEEGGIILKS